MSSAEDAAAAIAGVGAVAEVTTGGEPGDLPQTRFDRLSLERRVLGYVTDEVDFSPLGSRNTLAALTYSLMRDPGTIRPPATHGRLEVEGKTVEEIAQEVLDILGRLEEAGLVSSTKAGAYRVTKAGHEELGS